MRSIDVSNFAFGVLGMIGVTLASACKMDADVSTQAEDAEAEEATETDETSETTPDPVGPAPASPSQPTPVVLPPVQLSIDTVAETFTNVSPVRLIVMGDAALAVADSAQIRLLQGVGTITAQPRNDGSLAVDVTVPNGTDVTTLEVRLLPGAVRGEGRAQNTAAATSGLIHFNRTPLAATTTWLDDPATTVSARSVEITFDRDVELGSAAGFSVSGTAGGALQSLTQLDPRKAVARVDVTRPGSLQVDLVEGLAVDAFGNLSLAKTSSISVTNVFTSVVAGARHGCGLTFAGSLFCWGSDTYGQLGDGVGVNTSRLITKVAFPSLGTNEAIKDMRLGQYFGCAVTTVGRLYCWGRDERETVPDGLSLTVAETPVEVDLSFLNSGETVGSIALGHTHGCLISSENRTFCWGRGGFGVLGDGSVVDVASAVPKPIVTTNLEAGEWFTSIEAGYLHSCGVTNQSRAYCWGRNGATGPIGDGSTTANVPIPTKVRTDNLQAQETFTRVDVNGGFSCGLTNQHRLYCWGQNINSVLGNPSHVGNQTMPVPVDLSLLASGEHPVDFVASYSYGVMLTNQGRIYSWGDDTDGSLGNGPTVTAAQVRPAPIDVSGFAEAPSFIKLSPASTTGFCALTSRYELACWGRNDEGQVGNGGSTSVPAPLLIDTAQIQN